LVLSRHLAKRAAGDALGGMLRRALLYILLLAVLVGVDYAFNGAQVTLAVYYGSLQFGSSLSRVVGRIF
jgi:hypothetical protein